MEEIFGIVFIFGSVPLIVWLALNHKYKNRVKSAELVQALIAKDKDVTPELIKAVGFIPRRRHGDLRTGLILMAIGLAFITMGQMIPEEEAPLIMFGLASFPLFIGFAITAFWYFISRKDQD